MWSTVDVQDKDDILSASEYTTLTKLHANIKAACRNNTAPDAEAVVELIKRCPDPSCSRAGHSDASTNAVLWVGC